MLTARPGICRVLCVLFLLTLSSVYVVGQEDVVRFSGTVVDAENNAIAGAYVYLYEITTDPVDFRVHRRRVATDEADAEGRFVFQIDRSMGDISRHAVVLSVSAFHSMRWIRWDCLEDKAGVLRLGEYDSCAGVVTDAEGRPVRNGTVRAILKIPPSEAASDFYCFDWLTVETDAMGRFAFSHIPKDAVAEFHVEGEGKLSSHGSVRHYRDLPFQYKAGDKNIAVTVFDASSVSGIVVDPEGNPLADMRLAITGVYALGMGGAVSTTDSEGRFSFDQLGGGFYSIRLTDSDGNVGWGAQPLGLLLEKGQEKTNVRYRLSRTDTVTFVVKDSASGEPIEEADISLYRKGKEAYSYYVSFDNPSAYTIDGRTFHLLSGRYGYGVHARGYKELPYEKELVVRPGEGSTVTVKLDRLPPEERKEVGSRHVFEARAQSNKVEIRGSVSDESGQPLGGVVITVNDLLQQKEGDWYYQFRRVGDAVSNASGEYVFERERAGADVVHSVLVGYKEGCALGVGMLGLSDTTARRMTIEAGSKEYGGRVLDSRGEPIAGAWVCAYVSSYDVTGEYYDTKMEVKIGHTEWASSYTDEEGFFSIGHVPRFAKAEFLVSAEGYARLMTWNTLFGLGEMTIPAGKDDLEFFLFKAGALEGKVIDEESGTAIAGEKVFVSRQRDGIRAAKAWSVMSGTTSVKNPEGDNRMYISDAEGRFKAADLRPGVYDITLDTFSSSTRHWTAKAQEVEIGERETVEVEVAAVRPGTIEIVVVEKGSQTPVEGARVSLVVNGAQEEEPDAIVIRKGNSTITRRVANVVLRTPPGGSLEGDRQTLARINAIARNETVIPVKTDSKGVAVFRVAEGSYSIAFVSKSQYEYVPKEETLVVEAGETVRANVAMISLPGICGFCLDENNNPVDGAEITLENSEKILAVSDEQGWFEFDASLLSAREQTNAKLVGRHPELHLRGRTDMVRSGRNTIVLVSGILVSGRVVDSAGSPVAATVEVFSTRQDIMRVVSGLDDTRWNEYRGDYERPITSMAESHKTLTLEADGVFSLLLDPEVSHCLAFSAEGLGQCEELINHKYRDGRELPLGVADKDYMIHKTTVYHRNEKIIVQDRVWLFRPERDEIYMGDIVLPSLSSTLSGVIVDRMGNPLSEYVVRVIGGGQAVVEPRVTDKQGRFHFDNVIDGYVHLQASKGEYKVYQDWIRTGGGELRFVSTKHPQKESGEGSRDQSLCDVEISLVNELTGERIQYEKATIGITPENGTKFHLKPNDEGVFRVRLPEGKYMVDAAGYPVYESRNYIEVDIEGVSEKFLAISLRKHPVITGILHFPASVKPEDIEVSSEPSMKLTIFPSDFEVAPDGEFSCKVSLPEQDIPSQAWLLFRTKDWKYLAWTEIPLDDARMDITLEPEAIVKFIKPDKYSSYQWSWRQKLGEKAFSVYLPSPARKFEVKDGEYRGFRGLVANHEGLSYKLRIYTARKTIVVQSEDLEPGQETIITLP